MFRNSLPEFTSILTAWSDQSWLNVCVLLFCRCIQDVSTGLSKVLGYITSVKGLAAIRDQVWDLLQEVSAIQLQWKPTFTCHVRLLQWNERPSDTLKILQKTGSLEI